MLGATGASTLLATGVALYGPGAGAHQPDA